MALAILVLPVALLALLALAASAAGGLVAVGYNGAVLTSPDGSSWTVQPQPTAKSLFALAQGEELVATGADGAILHSADATAWGTPWTGTPQWIFGVATDGEDFVAVGTGGEILASPGSGFPWTPRMSGTGVDLWAVATDGTTWVAVGSGGTVLTSLDSVAWAPAPSSGATLRGLAYGGGLWVGVGDSGLIRTTPDLATWTTRLALGGGVGFNAVAWDGSLWVAVGTGGTIRTSPDALTWTAAGGGVGSLFAVAPPCGGGWVAVGTTGTIITSPTGSSWGAVFSGTPENLRGVSCILQCNPGVQNILTGASATFNAAGGSGVYTWTAPGGSPPSGNDLSFTTSFGVAGTYKVRVADATHGAQWRECTVTVTDPPPTTCAPAATNVRAGVPVTFTAGAGTAPYTWSAPGSAHPDPVVWPTLTTSFATVGTYTVTVHDAGPPVTTATCTVHVRKLACSPHTQTIFVGQSARLTASGGVPGFTWAAPGAKKESLVGTDIYPQYGDVGTYVVTLTDSDDPAQVVTCDVAVEPPPVGLDADQDGIHDQADNCPALANKGQEDADLDGEGDVCDPHPWPDEPGSGPSPPPSGAPDADRDGVPDASDNCPVVPNRDQGDYDRDGAGDLCDRDLDGDGVANAGVAALFMDNCPKVPNPGQEDRDDDGFGDACHLDTTPLSPDALDADAGGAALDSPWFGLALAAAPVAVALLGLVVVLAGRRRRRHAP